MRTLLLCLLTLALVGCSTPNSTVPTSQMPAKLFRSEAEVSGQKYTEIGRVSGSSCQLSTRESPPSISEARQDMLLRASRMNANAVILQDCEHTSGVPGCYRQAVCWGTAITVLAQ